MTILFPANEQYWFLSNLLGTPVMYQNKILGRIKDITALLNESLPRVSALLLTAPGRTLKILPWEMLEVKIHASGKVLLNSKSHELPLFTHASASHVMLRSHLLDRQIVDTAGAKVVRVNDLQLVLRRNILLLNKVDVGFTGLLRRACLLRPFNLLTQFFFEHKLTDNLISWNLVQSVGSEDLLRLRLSQNRLSRLHPADLADIIEDLDFPERARLFKALDIETAADILEETDTKVQLSLLSTVPDSRASDILDQMSPDEAADILQGMDQERAENILRDMEEDQAKDVRTLLTHDQKSAGGLMTTEYLTMGSMATVNQAMDFVREQAGENEVIYYIYVQDRGGGLLGVVSLRDMLLANPNASLASIMTGRPVYVDINADYEEVADMFVKYGLRALPVLDENMHLRGVLRLKALLETVAQRLK
ncbi:MAG: CBS domain-containing protein [Desulfarculales bacterium]|jgi:CBS domain-containing protein/sporulation protein YlmC with PRC-barrel domain|nr:CBS domain-containing protein [Desulfarculales bacterium]